MGVVEVGVVCCVETLGQFETSVGSHTAVAGWEDCLFGALSVDPGVNGVDCTCGAGVEV